MNELQCPRCRVLLEARSDEQWRCRSCGGALLGRGAVRALLHAGEQGKLPVEKPWNYREAAARPSTPDSKDLADETVTYVPCPMCGALMLRTRVLRNEPAVADVCVLHALWFDHGELEQVMLVLSREGEGSLAVVRPLIARHFRDGPET